MLYSLTRNPVNYCLLNPLCSDQHCRRPSPETSMLVSVLCQSLDLSLRPVDPLHFFLYRSPPGLFWFFPGGIHLNATIEMEVGRLLHTCPIHCHLLFLIACDRRVVLILRYNNSFDMVFGKKMRRILRRQRV